VDAAFTLTRLSEDLALLLDENDFEGAEELLSACLARHPEWQGFIHFHLGRVYRKWNKLTSAVQHLNQAVDAAVGNELFLVQVLDELNQAKKAQVTQRP
jgi:uncharacterized protein HemY